MPSSHKVARVDRKADWKFSTNNGWQDYELAICEILSEAFHARHPLCRFETKFGTYEVNFKDMTQRPVHGYGKVRQVRYIRPADDSDSDAEEEQKISAEERRLLQEMIHPLLARMPMPAVIASPSETTGTTKGGRHELGAGLAGTIVNLAANFADQLRAGFAYRNVAKIQILEFHIPEILMSAISLSLYYACIEIDSPIELEISLSATREQASALFAAWRFWKGRANEPASSIKLFPLSKDVTGHTWLMNGHGSECRLKRLAGAFSTLRFGNSFEGLASLVKNTQNLHCQSKTSGFIANNAFKINLTHSSNTVMEEAVRQAQGGFKVAAVSAASAYHIGGGFLSGGRHALEEAICMQSTLYLSLNKAAQLARDSGVCDLLGRRINIPEDGVVYSPGVEVFREGTLQGYAPMKVAGATRLAAVVSVAMPNKNVQVKDSPLDVRSDFQYRQLIDKKWRAVLHGVVQAGANVLVVPDVGCGVFRNDPSKIGHALGHALLHHRSQLVEVIVTGSQEFFDAINKVFTASKKPTSPCPLPAGSKVHITENSRRLASPRMNEDEKAEEAPGCMELLCHSLQASWYRLCNDKLASKQKGLALRTSMDLRAKRPDLIAPWSSIISGTIVNEKWLKVRDILIPKADAWIPSIKIRKEDAFFLPMQMAKFDVLSPETQLSDEECCRIRDSDESAASKDVPMVLEEPASTVTNESEASHASQEQLALEIEDTVNAEKKVLRDLLNDMYLKSATRAERTLRDTSLHAKNPVSDFKPVDGVGGELVQLSNETAADMNVVPDVVSDNNSTDDIDMTSSPALIISETGAEEERTDKFAQASSPSQSQSETCNMVQGVVAHADESTPDSAAPEFAAQALASEKANKTSISPTDIGKPTKKARCETSKESHIEQCAFTDQQKRIEAREQIAAWVQAKHYDKLRVAIMNAERVGIDTSSLADARQELCALQKEQEAARKEMNRACKSCHYSCLEEAIKSAKKARLAESEVIAAEACMEKIKKEHADASQKISQAMEAMDCNLLRDAVTHAEQIRLKSAVLEAAIKELRKFEEEKQHAQKELQEACKGGRCVCLQKAIESAKNAGLCIGDVRAAEERLQELKHQQAEISRLVVDGFIQTKDCKILEEVISRTEKLGLDADELTVAKRHLQTIQAEQCHARLALKDACDKGRRTCLEEGIQLAKKAGLSEHEVKAATDCLHILEQKHVVAMAQVAKHLKEKDCDSIQRAISVVQSIHFDGKAVESAIKKLLELQNEQAAARTELHIALQSRQISCLEKSIARAQTAGLQEHEFATSTRKLEEIQDQHSILSKKISTAFQAKDYEQMKKAACDAEESSWVSELADDAKAKLQALRVEQDDARRELRTALEIRQIACLQKSIDRAQKAGLREHELSTSTRKLKEIQHQISILSKKISAAFQAKDYDQMKKAASDAEKNGWDAQLADDAKAKLQALRVEQDAARIELYRALEQKNVESISINIRLASKAGCRPVEIEHFEHLMGQVKQKQKRALHSLEVALGKRQVAAIRHAIKCAEEAGVDRNKIAGSQERLEKIQCEHEEAAHQIKQALAAKNVDEVIRAIDRAKAVGKDTSSDHEHLKLLQEDQQKNILADFKAALASKDLKAACTFFRHAEQFCKNSSIINEARKSLSGLALERLEKACDSGALSRLDAMEPRLKIEATKCYIDKALRTKDVCLHCHAISMSRFFQLESDSVRDINHLLQSLVQDMMVKTYKKTWTHDRKRIAQKHSLAEHYAESVPLGYELVSVEVAALNNFLDLRSSYSRVADKIPDASDKIETMTRPWAESLKGSKNEWLHFHGTTASSAQKILKSGFDIALATPKSACGQGVYLAESITKADEYAVPDSEGNRTVLVCQMLGGNVNVTEETNPKGKGILESIGYDAPYQSVLNDREKVRGTYKEFFVSDPKQVLPICMVKYKWRA